MNGIRKFSILGLGVAGFAGLVFVLSAAFDNEQMVQGQTVKKRVVETADAPKAIGPYSQGITANGFVYTSGQIGSDPKTGMLVEGGIAEQTEQALKNIEAVLKASDSSLDGVVKTTVFLADMNDFAKMNEVYAKRFGAPFPARSTVQVARLPRDAKVEIEAVAVLKK
jgi:2-iminobutanoate/2-iminopropanoate deaminase